MNEEQYELEEYNETEDDQLIQYAQENQHINDETLHFAEKILSSENKYLPPVAKRELSCLISITQRTTNLNDNAIEAQLNAFQAQIARIKRNIPRGYLDERILNFLANAEREYYAILYGSRGGFSRRALNTHITEVHSLKNNNTQEQPKKSIFGGFGKK